MAKIRFYFDEMMPHAVQKGLTARDYEVIMAVEVGMVEKDDLTEHLPYAANRGLVLVSCDQKFAGLAASLSDHAGVICWTGKQDDFGGMVNQLSKFAEEHDTEAVKGQVFWIK